MRQVLVATDFSQRSRRAVRRAALVAGEAGARLLLLHVVDDDRDARLVEADAVAARAALADIRQSDCAGLHCEARVELGDPFDAIVRMARQWPADLVVMGSHRRQLLRDIFVGTTVERVTRSRVAPVLMVNADAAGPYRRALVGVDLSVHCARAIRFARDSGVLAQADVALVHAFDAVGAGKLGFAGVEAATIRQYVGEMGGRARSAVLAFVADHGLDAPGSVQVAQGHPLAVLPEAVRSSQPDLVVLATHGPSALARLLLGSVTEALMRDLERDVLAVPPPSKS